MPKFYIKTYGCQMNERDSQQVAFSLAARGYQQVHDATQADVVLLNTCSVRDMADQKALGKMGMLGRLAKRRPQVVFGFLGCMAQARGESLLKQMPHVDLVLGTQKFHRVADYVDELVARKAGRARPPGAPHPNGWPSAPAQPFEDLRYSICDTAQEAGSQNSIARQQLAPRQVSAFVSIMQGCNMHCTFCIVPRTRGAERSRPIHDIVGEVRDLVSRGVKEVTLLGQIVNLYGRHEFPSVTAVCRRRDRPQSCESAVIERRYSKSPFVQLLEAVHEIDGLERLRFTSPHPIGFRDDLIGAFAELPKLVEHVHLPVQSGSNRILKAMHRTYTAEKYIALVEKLRAARPEIAITTDIIVGFPGEEENDYRATRALVERIRFDNAFVFRYSPRAETPAATMPDQLDEAVKEERNQDLLRLVDDLAARSNARLVDREIEILCEGPSRTNSARLMGRTRTNKIVVFEGAAQCAGELMNIHITQANGFSLYGRPVRSEVAAA